MTDTERLNFIQANEAHTGYADGVFSCLVWGWHGLVWCVVASGHDLTLRDAIDRAAAKLASDKAKVRAA